MSSFDIILARHGDTWTDQNGNTFDGYFSSDPEILSVPTDTDIPTGTIITQQCSGDSYLVFQVENLKQWLELAVLQLDRLATISCNTVGSPNDFGYSSGTTAIIHESVPLAITGSTAKNDSSRVRDTTVTTYQIATSAGYDIRVGYQISMGRDPLTVRTVDSDDNVLQITAINV